MAGVAAVAQHRLKFNVCKSGMAKFLLHACMNEEIICKLVNYYMMDELMPLSHLNMTRVCLESGYVKSGPSVGLLNSINGETTVNVFYVSILWNLAEVECGYNYRAYYVAYHTWQY